MTDAPRRPRQLLVLGTSGTVGTGIGPEGRIWPELVRQGLAASGGEVELTLRRVYVHSGNPFEFLERELDRVQPDYIAMQCTAFPATQKTVAHRVNRLLGKRLADWTEARVLTVDKATRRKGPVRHRMNRAGHIVARKVVGTSPMVPYRYLVDGYLKAIDRVARVESAQVVVIGTGAASPGHQRNNREVDNLKERFDGELSAAAKRKHLAWVSSAEATREAGAPEEVFVDMLHKGQAWHDGIAARVLAAFTRRQD